MQEHEADMHTLSKSRILAYRQRPRRLWLEIHHPELREDSEAAHARFATGHQVGRSPASSTTRSNGES